MSGKNHTVLGMMSGSSLDGIDLALCKFKYNTKWSYEWIQTEVHRFSNEWVQKLKSLPTAGAEELVRQDILFGQYLGQVASAFLSKHNLKADYIASHGHTIFHRPEEGFTFQLGNGQVIAQYSGIQTISNFRAKDISFGGQGAPLVPIGDLLLFPEMECCLNLGGIANISIKQGNQITGFDICPANQLLNYLSQQLGFEYDNNGATARKGRMIPSLYEALNAQTYYQKPFPKSLSNEEVQSEFIPLMDQFRESNEDKLFTVIRHLAHQISRVVRKEAHQKVLVTGGGAHNDFLIEMLQEESPVTWIIPDNRLIDFKESLIFAFMGVLRVEGLNNCLASVTGARQDSSGGDIFFP
ncbi:MAG: anhydro-N-acetylmuramic acid kinase [Bacteroidales bacterium]|nr:anhydro-N-acetylmuramic acid kinase [Bacteroidales bacterium]